MNFKNSFIELIEMISLENGMEESRAIVSILLDDVFGIKQMDFYLMEEREMNEDEEKVFSLVQQRLLNNEPIQYITGVADFFGMKMKVNPSVLIPRSETEELVEWIIRETGDGRRKTEEKSLKTEDSVSLSLSKTQKNKIRILDIGTGSGCIAIALKKNIPDAEVYAMDISEEALDVAKANAELNDVEINFVQDNILNPTSDFRLTTFDLIVSNPPYVTKAEADLISDNVKNFEPHLALFVPDDDAMKFYKAIKVFAEKHLCGWSETNHGGADGKIFLEINETKGEEVKNLFSEKWKTEIKNDMQGKNRMMKVSK